MNKLEKVCIFVIPISFLIMSIVAVTRYVHFTLDSNRIHNIALEMEIDELRVLYEDSISTDGYMIPEKDHIVFPFFPDSGIFVTSQFHLRTNPFEINTGPNRPEERIHRGIDIVSTKQNAIRATVSGEVVRHFPPPDGYWRGFGVFGGVVIIEDENGYYHKYSHLSETYVKSLPISERTYAIAGETIIGRQGNSGRTTGAHLHYEIYTGPDPDTPEVWYDPIYYFDIALTEDGEVMFPVNENTVLDIQRNE